MSKLVYIPTYNRLQLTREFFNLEKDIYLCFIYDPPGNSTYTHSLEENILDILEEDITKYAVDGDIILMGDINARTGDQETDFYSIRNEALGCYPIINYSATSWSVVS
jgi:hypothetical protein